MLRALVLGLVLANGAFFLWSQGHMHAWGLSPVEQREPDRLQQQIAPETIRLLPNPGSQEEAPALGTTPAPSDAPPQTGS
jgi:hypothetical protein